MTEAKLTFKQMCAKFNVTPRTLRFYEYIELLAPIKEGRSRFYGARDVARMTLILRGRHFGLSLEEIRQWLLIYHKNGTQSQLQEWLRIADRQLLILERQQQDIQTAIKDLQELRAKSADELARLQAENSTAHPE